MPDWWTQLTNIDGLAQLMATVGPILLIAIIFAETGILAGFFLPGDSLLLTAGVVSALYPQHLDFTTIGILLSLAAIAGDWLNFHLGAWTGARIWQRPDSRFFKRAHLEEAHDFYQRWGAWAIVGGRFVPIVRTFVPFVAGVAKMPYRAFVLWNVLGALLWVWSMLGLGHWLAGYETMRANLHYLVLAVVAISFVPVVIGVFNRWRRGRRAATDQGLRLDGATVEDARS